MGALALIPQSKKLLAPQLDYFLIDGSGSMKSKWWDTLAALDNFRSTLNAANSHSHGIVSVFSGADIQMIQRDSMLSDWKPFTTEPLGSTWGGTPLYDAIILMGKHLRDLNPERCSIVIVTDGGENGSINSLDQASAVLDWCRAHGWNVTFLGADFRNDKQAKQLGASDKNSIGVRREMIADAGKLLAKKRLAGDEISFSDDEKATFGGYLANHSFP